MLGCDSTAAARASSSRRCRRSGSAGDRRGDDLQRDGPADLRVARAIHLADAPFADALEQVVMGDGSHHRSSSCAAATAGSRRGSAGCARRAQSDRRPPAPRRPARASNRASPDDPRPPNPVDTEPGHDVAHADVVVPQLLHQRLAEGVQAGLRRAVGGAAGERVLARQAADVDDEPAAPRASSPGSRRGMQ